MWNAGWSYEEIEEILMVNGRSLRRWRRNYEIHGTGIPPRNPLQGRPPKLFTEQIQFLMQTVTTNPALYLDELQEIMGLEYDVALSRSRIHRLVEDAGLSLKKLRRCAAERDEEQRAEFLHYVSTNFSAEMVISVDESSKDDRTIYRHYGRAPHGQRPTIYANFVRGERWSILPALTIDGYLALEVIQGSIDSILFYDFIVEKVVSRTFHNALNLNN